MTKNDRKIPVGLVGKKIGMTRIFTDAGIAFPVTVIEATPNRILRLKTLEKDGYQAIQVTIGHKKASRCNKSEAGLFAKTGVEAGTHLIEFKVSNSAEYKAGDALKVDLFQVGQKVDVSGQSKGKGFQGAVKRWNFKTQDATHGNSLSHRAPGSTGMCQTPGRVFKGKKMAGQMGNVKKTIQSLEIIRIDLDQHLILVKGAIPGAINSNVIIKPAVKSSTLA
ncbi:MAG: 50S ribosomal protein L3 [Endozoicomonadaceae bacterium]|nr:50S ribosomal protein L3 [Endozoicomonadaceae bacterium]